MALQETQDKVGVQTAPSGNPTKRTGREDGFGQTQPKVGTPGETSGPIDRGGRRDSGVAPGKRGYKPADTGDQSTKNASAGRVERIG